MTFPFGDTEVPLQDPTIHGGTTAGVPSLAARASVPARTNDKDLEARIRPAPEEHRFVAAASGGRRETFGTLNDARTFVEHLYKKWWGWRRSDAWASEDGQGRWLILSSSGRIEASLYHSPDQDMRRLEWRADGEYSELQKTAQLWEEEVDVVEDLDTRQEHPGTTRGPENDPQD